MLSGRIMLMGRRLLSVSLGDCVLGGVMLTEMQMGVVNCEH